MSTDNNDQKISEFRNDYSIDFLLAEYERLKDVRSQMSQRASRRFEFYLTITSAIIGAFLVLTQTQAQLTMSQIMIDLIALGLLGYGIVTFMNITFASTFDIQILRAIKSIERYFTERDPEITDYLYFSSPPSNSNSYGFARVLTRGMGGGSEKSLITLIDGAIITYLLISLLNNHLNIQISGAGLIIISVTTFLVSSVVHVLYVTSMYRYSAARS